MENVDQLEESPAGLLKHTNVQGPCLFCGGPSDTEEDVIPNWYRRRATREVYLTLPNNTRLRHLRAVVPACNDCNNLFSKIETRMANETFTENEVYIWAFKVHAGLLYMDMRLPADRADSASVRLAHPHENAFAEHVSQFRALVHVWRQEHCRFRPSPLGSVFKVDSFFPKRFSFFHAPQGYVGINLTTSFVAVALFDGGLAKKGAYDAPTEQEMDKLFPPSGAAIGTESENVRRECYQRYWLARLIYYLQNVTASIQFRSREAIVRGRVGDAPLPPDDDKARLDCLRAVGLEEVKLEDGRKGVKLMASVR